MSRTLTEIVVFVSSPGDLAEERAIVLGAVEEVNRILRSEGLMVTPLLWERDAVPGRGEGSAQDLVSRDLLAQSDILMLLMHHRVGTPVPGYLSGTIQEFEEAHSIVESSSRPYEIMSYFSVAPVSPEIDVDQLRSMQEFKKRVESLGYLRKNFESPSILHSIVISHLVEKARSIQAKLGGNTAVKPTRAEPSRSQRVAPLIDEHDDDEGLGSLDYEEIVNTRLLVATKLIERVGELTNRHVQVASEFVERFKSAADIASRGIPIDRRGLVNEYAVELADHTHALTPVVDQFETELSEGAQAVLGLVTELVAESNNQVALQNIVDAIKPSRMNMEQFAAGLSLLSTRVSEMPGLTQLIKKSRNKAQRLYFRLSSVTTQSIASFDQAVEAAEDHLRRHPPES